MTPLQLFNEYQKDWPTVEQMAEHYKMDPEELWEKIQEGQREHYRQWSKPLNKSERAERLALAAIDYIERSRFK